nr:hypothetical protein [Candidatus Nitrotoga fabula]
MCHYQLQRFLPTPPGRITVTANTTANFLSSPGVLRASRQDAVLPGPAIASTWWIPASDQQQQEKEECAASGPFLIVFPNLQPYCARQPRYWHSQSDDQKAAA